MFPPPRASATLKGTARTAGGTFMARYHRIGWAAVLVAALAAGCEDKEATQGKPNPEPPDPKANVPVEGKRAPMGDNVWLEVLPNGSRRVVVAAEVCLRQGPLEQLMTRKNKKE